MAHPIFYRLLLFFGSVVMSVHALAEPTEIYTGGIQPYGGTSDVALRIATGGAGQSGLVKGTHSAHPFFLSLNA
jgi:hypothetical protein